MVLSALIWTTGCHVGYLFPSSNRKKISSRNNGKMEGEKMNDNRERYQEPAYLFGSSHQRVPHHKHIPSRSYSFF